MFFRIQVRVEMEYGKIFFQVFRKGFVTAANRSVRHAMVPSHYYGKGFFANLLHGFGDVILRLPHIGRNAKNVSVVGYGKIVGPQIRLRFRIEEFFTVHPFQKTVFPHSFRAVHGSSAIRHTGV